MRCHFAILIACLEGIPEEITEVDIYKSPYLNSPINNGAAKIA
jgi:hypothetical protein